MITRPSDGFFFFRFHGSLSVIKTWLSRHTLLNAVQRISLCVLSRVHVHAIDVVSDQVVARTCIGAIDKRPNVNTNLASLCPYNLT